MKKIIIFIVVAIGLLSINNLYSRKNGEIGNAKDGCGNCHGQNANPVVSITSSSPSNFTTYPGYEIVITVNLSAELYSWAGINITITSDYSGDNDAGTLTPTSSYLKLWAGELTHNSAVPMQDGSVDFVFKWRAPEQTGNYYFRVAGTANYNDDEAGGGDRWNLMDYKIIRVVEFPREITVTSPNGGETLCNGTSYDITWTSEYVDNVKIEWSKDGGSTYPVEITESEPASSGSFNWHISGSQTGNNNKIKITDINHSEVKDESNQNFTIKNKTKMLDHPTAQEVCAGDTVSFSVTASGDNLLYQWRKNSNNIPDTDNNHYTIYDVKKTHAGYYDVIVTGDCGDPLTSESAKLSLFDQPVISTQPTNDTACAGEKHMIIIIVTKSKIIEWYKDGNKLDIPSSSIYGIDTVDYADEGFYFARAINVCGDEVISDSVYISVVEKPNITIEPDNWTAIEGDSIAIKVSTNTNIVEYQWRKDESPIPGAVDSVYSIKETSLEDSGNYDCMVSNKCGSDTSEMAILTVNERPQGSELSFLQDTVALGYILLKSDSTITLSGFLSNVGSGTLEIKAISFIDADSTSIEIISPEINTQIAPSESVDLIISCNIQEPCEFEAGIEIKNEADSTYILFLNGFGADVNVEIVDTLDFGFIGSDQELPVDSTIYLKNLSNLPLTIDTIEISEDVKDAFTFSTVELPFLLNQNDSIGILVEFFVEYPTYLHKAKMNIKLGDFDKLYTTDIICDFVDVSVDDNPLKHFKIYPNPANDNFIIEFSHQENAPANITLLDNMGRELLYFDKIYPENGNYRMMCDFAGNNLPPSGVYWIRIKISDGIFVKPLFIVR